jgi:hypothetical protein
MRGLIVAAVVIALGAGAPGAPAAPSSSKRDCGPRSAHTVARNRLVRVYRNPRGHYYACAIRNGKHTNVGSAFLRLRGRYVSYVERACDERFGCSFELVVVDVPGDAYPAATDSTPGRVLKTVATSRGEAAALAETEDGRERFLLKVDWMGTTELDRGPDVRALTLRDRRLRWLSGDVRRGAPVANGRRCGLGPSRRVDTRALSDELRVYTVYREPSDEEEYSDYYACLRPGGKPLKLVRESISPDDRTAAAVTDLVLAGRFVGFSELGSYVSESVVKVVSVGARRGVRREWVDGYLHDLVVSEDGLAAGIATEITEEDAVYAFDSRGKTELARGADLHDLTLDGTRLSWFNGSEQRTAELAGP